MRVLVCGGRDFKDEGRLFRRLDEAHKVRMITLIIEGGARGADRMAGKWAILHGVPLLVVNADWDKHGKSAGYIRNIEMLNASPDLVIAFPGGRGTAHMVKIAKDRGVNVTEVNV